MLHLLLKRASDMVRVKENQGILLWYRRTSNDIDIGQIEPTIWKLIFPGQIELTIWILIFPGQIEPTV